MLRRVVGEQRRLELVRRDAGGEQQQREDDEQTVVRQLVAHRAVERARVVVAAAAQREHQEERALHWITMAGSGASVHATCEASRLGFVASASGQARMMKSASPMLEMQLRSVAAYVPPFAAVRTGSITPSQPRSGTMYGPVAWISPSAEINNAPSGPVGMSLVPANVLSWIEIAVGY